eukprot:GEMP01088197.1.p1 GENE.GEMP01088197.1~~GEMP01088197.1.p1  ORF type:complete len:165 (+),score=32.09 GEMP01088197.1:82-576(+)
MRCRRLAFVSALLRHFTAEMTPATQIRQRLDGDAGKGIIQLPINAGKDVMQPSFELLEKYGYQAFDGDNCTYRFGVHVSQLTRPAPIAKEKTCSADQSKASACREEPSVQLCGTPRSSFFKSDADRNHSSRTMPNALLLLAILIFPVDAALISLTNVFLFVREH